MSVAETPERRVAQMVERHGPALMRVARHFSLCRDDALDAYQRGLEIYLRRVDSLDRATELAWLKVVVRHEAMAVRRGRQESVASADMDLDAYAAAEQRSVDEHVASNERRSRSAEALRHLKPDEATALMLKAEGHSYREIGDRLGWTYTKTNRAITEGRARFMKVFGRIEAGEECERFTPALVLIATGNANAEALLEIRPHLHHCAHCRAAIRGLHMRRRAPAAALIPLPILVPLRWLGAKLGLGQSGHATPRDDTGHHSGVLFHPDRVIDGAWTTTPDHKHVDIESLDFEPTSSSSSTSAAVDTSPQHLTSPDFSVPTDVPTSESLSHPDALLDRLDHATTAVDTSTPLQRLHPLQLKQDLYSLAHRFHASDVATGVQIAGSAGSGRGTVIATLIGLCLSGAGAGAACIATGLLSSPTPLTSHLPKLQQRSPRPLATTNDQRHNAARGGSYRTKPSRPRPRSAATRSRTSPTPARSRNISQARKPAMRSTSARHTRDHDDSARREFDFEARATRSASSSGTQAATPATVHGAATGAFESGAATSSTPSHSRNPQRSPQRDPAQQEFGLER